MPRYMIACRFSIALAVSCWLLATGLAAEKVFRDGVSSVTLLLAMPVLTAAVGVLLHQGFDDLRNFRWLRGPTALLLAGVCLAVTLPASIGSSGGARDAAISQAEATNRGVKIAEASYDSAARDLADAKAGVRRECEGAPAVITDNTWPKCQWWRRQMQAHEFAMTRFGKDLAKAPAEVIADSGEQRVAWLLSGLASRWGYSITKADVQQAWPVLPPIAFELLCAFFISCGVSRRTSPRSNGVRDGDREEAPMQVVAEPLTPTLSPSAGGEPSDPRPRKRTTPRQKRRDRVVAAIRKQTLEGKRPTFKLVKARYRLANATASRYMKEAAA